jgi:RNase P/RNase MRP subunit p29
MGQKGYCPYDYYTSRKEECKSKLITKRNILCHELIGQKIVIARSDCSSLRNLGGKVVYETQQSLFIKTHFGIKQIMKGVASEIKIDLWDGDACFINGRSLIGRPEDRIMRAC